MRRNKTTMFKKLFLFSLIAIHTHIAGMEIELYSPFSEIPRDVTEYIMHSTDAIRDVYTFSLTSKEHHELYNANNILLKNEYLCSSLSPIQHTLLLVKSAQQNNQKMIKKIIETENTVNTANRENILSYFKYKITPDSSFDLIDCCIKGYKGLHNQNDTIVNNILNTVGTLNYYPLLILIKNNANINKPDFFNKSPLALAVGLKNKPIVELLLKYNCNKNTYDKTGQTALHWACLKDQEELIFYEIVKLLLDNQCNLNMQDNNNDTPLHIVVRRKNFTIAKLLLSYGADTTIKNTRGKKALELTGKTNRQMLKTYMPTNKRKRTDSVEATKEPVSKKNRK